MLLNNMNLVLLTKEELEKVYKERMVEDFPPSELKPLEMLYKLCDKNMYICFGLKDSCQILGYTFLIKNGDDYLIDYLATYPERRNQGLGSMIIGMLDEYLSDQGAKSIIGEVENPDMAESEEDRALQTRRYGFYMRNGFKDTGVRVVCFKAPFILIEMGRELKHSEEEVKELYAMHLKSMITDEMFEKNVFI